MKDHTMLIILLGIITTVFIFLTIMVQIFPYSLEVHVYSSYYHLECMSPNNVLDYANGILISFSMISSTYLGGLSVKIRNLKKQFNESKEIAVILYNNTIILLILLLMFLGVFEKFDPMTRYIIVSTLWCYMICFDVSLLLLPKFVIVFKDILYSSDKDKQTEKQLKNNSKSSSILTPNAAISESDVKFLASNTASVGTGNSNSDVVSFMNV